MAGKTPAGIPQEMAVKAGTTTEYECVTQKDALAGNVYKNMTREETDQSKGNKPWPPRDQKISEYQCGLELQFDEERRACALKALRSAAAAQQPPSVQLECAASVLGLEPAWGSLPSKTATPLVTVELPTTSPSLLFIGRDRDHAAAEMVSYLDLLLMNPPRDPFLEIQEAAQARREK